MLGEMLHLCFLGRLLCEMRLPPRNICILNPLKKFATIVADYILKLSCGFKREKYAAHICMIFLFLAMAQQVLPRCRKA